MVPAGTGTQKVKKRVTRFYGTHTVRYDIVQVYATVPTVPVPYQHYKLLIVPVFPMHWVPLCAYLYCCELSAHLDPSTRLQRPARLPFSAFFLSLKRIIESAIRLAACCPMHSHSGKVLCVCIPTLQPGWTTVGLEPFKLNSLHLFTANCHAWQQHHRLYARNKWKNAVISAYYFRSKVKGKCT